MATKKLDHYLAIYVGVRDDLDRERIRLWDMLRYDRCHPIHMEALHEFLVFKQEYRQDFTGGFHLGRWASVSSVPGERMITVSAPDEHKPPVRIPRGDGAPKPRHAGKGGAADSQQPVRTHVPVVRCSRDSG